MHVFVILLLMCASTLDFSFALKFCPHMPHVHLRLSMSTVCPTFTLNGPLSIMKVAIIASVSLLKFDARRGTARETK